MMVIEGDNITFTHRATTRNATIHHVTIYRESGNAAQLNKQLNKQLNEQLNLF